MTDTTPTIDPRHTALLVMDYQSGIVGRLPNAEAQLSLMSEVIGIARGHGLTIGYVRVAFDDDDLAAVPATNKIFARIASAGRIMHREPPRRPSTTPSRQSLETSWSARPASARSPPPISSGS